MTTSTATATATATAKPTTKAPRINKYLYLYILQGFYALGWEDLTASENRAEVRANLKDYRDNERGNYRIVYRVEPNPEHVRKLIQTKKR